MCGIAGYFAWDRRSVPSRTLYEMGAAVAHRGPDDEGYVWIDPMGRRVTEYGGATTPDSIDLPRWGDASPPPSSPIGLAHRRFSIFDTTSAGHQPMWSAGREATVVFNGEIYNHAELRDELQALGHAFHSRSDTEVLLAAYLEWGEACFERFYGFFAIALWDHRRRQLLLARDRMGKAPLYLRRERDALWFASEIKALRIGQVGRPPVHEQAVLDFVDLDRRDLHQRTFFEDITSFPRASFAWVDERGRYTPVTYWRLPERRLHVDFSPEEAAAELRRRLESAVEVRLRADVPVAFELSGGMDSSSLVSLAATTRHRLHTFTVGFPGTQADERPYANAVLAYHPGRFEHTEMQPPADAFFQNADAFVAHMEEPFRSPNLHTHQSLWRAIAATGVRVSINGAAGDEVLAGYSEEYFAWHLKGLLHRGRPLHALRAFAQCKDRAGADWARHAIVTSGRIVGSDRLRDWYRFRNRPVDPFLRPRDLHTSVGPSRDFSQRIVDNLGDWMISYWMRSGNTAYMGIPLEVRSPFLDHRVVEFVSSLPPDYLIRDGWFKWLLRKGMEDLLPPEVTWRREKMGFPFPWRAWLSDNKSAFFHAIGDVDCPYVRMTVLRDGYDALVHADPQYLWRLMSLTLWWKRTILGEPLHA